MASCKACTRTPFGPSIAQSVSSRSTSCRCSARFVSTSSKDLTAAACAWACRKIKSPLAIRPFRVVFWVSCALVAGRYVISGSLASNCTVRPASLHGRDLLFHRLEILAPAGLHRLPFRIAGVQLRHLGQFPAERSDRRDGRGRLGERELFLACGHLRLEQFGGLLKVGFRRLA